MSTDHYAEAEGCLATAALCPRGSEDERTSLAYAQVHATLATVQRPEPSHAATSRTIPWPPSDELVERVAAAIYGHDHPGWQSWDQSPARIRDRYLAKARVVLSAIGGQS